MTATPESASSFAPEAGDHVRGWNDVLALWRLCRNTKCARSRACRGRDALLCFHAHLALVPESLMEWTRELADAQNEGVSFDTAVERMRGTGAETALEDWYEAIAYSERLMSIGIASPPMKTK
jgi:hypothetical protein